MKHYYQMMKSLKFEEIDRGNTKTGLVSEKAFVFPGSFDPPTYGHLEIIRQASMIFPKITILCSINDSKKYWFSEDQRACLWSAYDLPENVQVQTFSEFISKHDFTKEIVMIRGLRDSADFEHEKQVLFRNLADFGVNKVLYIHTPAPFIDVSSSAVRACTTKLQLSQLHKYVAPKVVTALLEQRLHAKNVFMVVGNPGSGKSIFLREMCNKYDDVVAVFTDSYNVHIMPVLQKAFPGKTLESIVLEHANEYVDLVKDIWFEKLAEELLRIPPDKHVFIEIAYGMHDSKKMYRFFGGKIIYFRCSTEENIKRLHNRGTLEHIPLITAIPTESETRDIAKKERCEVYTIDTTFLYEQEIQMQKLYTRINTKGENNEL